MSMGSDRGRSGRSSRATLAGFAVCLAFVAWAAPSASAAAGRVFDPVLSLTGACGTSTTDPTPDPWCPGPPRPSKPFETPNIVIDRFGDMYVASFGSETDGSDGRVDVFSPGGEFITEFPVTAPRAIAIDTKGNFYFLQQASVVGLPRQVERLSPTLYEPLSEEIEYGGSPVVVVEESTADLGGLEAQTGLAVDPTTNHLFVATSNVVGEFSSAEEGNDFLAAIGKGILSNQSKYVGIDSASNRLFVSDFDEALGRSVIRVFELKAPHDLVGTIDASCTSAGKFLTLEAHLTIDADEQTGHIFVGDLTASHKVYEFGAGLEEEEECLTTYEHKFEGLFSQEVAIDNGPASPSRGVLYVPSGGPVDHTYAFSFAEAPPLVESASSSGVTESEALLKATINPGGGETTYRFEYTTQQQFEEEGFAGATVAGEGTLQAGVVGEEVSVPLTGLQPGTAYRFRAVASNSVGNDEAEAHFRTYSAAPLPSCPNESLRAGLSALLPDCRSYELVTPPDTNGRAARGVAYTGVYFPTLESSPDGGKLTFLIEGGSLPGSDGSGTFNGENYLARRGSDGWSTEITAPSGSDASSPLPGGVSPDQEHSFWGGEGSGEFVKSPFIRYPDGHSEPVGRGSLGTDPRVEAKLIAENGSHVVFASHTSLAFPAMQLEENAPPEGTTAVYDRTADEVTHVVSLLPGGATPGKGENALYVGASYDGEGIAFSIGSTLYLRYHDEESYKIGNGLTYAGIAEGGGRIFYVEGGDLYAFDVASGEAIAFSDSGNVTPVNVSSDGSAAYFISPSKLTGEGEPNPNGALPQKGKDNLYLSRGGQLSFVGTVEPQDVVDEEGGVTGLGLWTYSLLSPWQPGLETSRVNPDGGVLLFQSQAPLTEYRPEGHTEIYRYDFAAQALECLSCNPTEASARSDASLETFAETAGGPVSPIARIVNLRADGRRAFFQSSEPLVPNDTDGVQDVYEWEAQGVGSCERQGGCIYLISSGQSPRDNYLFSVSESGNDVFIQTSELLLGRDSDETPSIYDARVGGGFSEEAPIPCQGEGCHPMSSAPSLPSPVTTAAGPSGNAQKPHCKKGKVKRHGHCVKKRHGHKHRGASKKRGAGK